jgi:general secretion pathway protein K
MATTTNKGGALLAVLWLSAALSAIAFSLAASVRGETERATTALDSVRAYYVATGGLERALLHIEWGPPYYVSGAPRMVFQFASGEAVVELIPEDAKVNVNTAPVEELYRLLTALGAGDAQAREITFAIEDWRSPVGMTARPALDDYYLSLNPSFRPRHASFQEIEELLLVKGMTPELFYGSYERAGDGALRPRGALKDCVAVMGGGQFDVNTAPPAALLSTGLAPDLVAALVAARRVAPFQTQDEVRTLIGNAPGSERLGIGGGLFMTLRSTGRIRLQNGQLSDERRSVAAMVKLQAPDNGRPYTILRWNDNAWAQ